MPDNAGAQHSPQREREGRGGGGGGGVARRGEPESGRYDARHDGKSNPLSGGRQGKRLTDKRDGRKTERERGEGAPKGLADQRGTPSKIMTMRKEMVAVVVVGGGRQSRDREGCRQERVGGGDTDTHTYTPPKGNFHPTHEGLEQGRVVLRKVWIVTRVGLYMHMCAPLSYTG